MAGAITLSHLSPLTTPSAGTSRSMSTSVTRPLYAGIASLLRAYATT